MTTEFDPSGTWHNQHGSELRLAVSEEGRLTGKFVSATGMARGEACEVVGFASRDLVAFTTNFSKHGSLTSWTGHWVREDGEPTLQASWNMCVVGPKGGDPETHWRGVWTGADVFRRGPAPAREAKKGESRIRPSHPLPEWP
jgi:hypothetical protein